MSNKKTIAVMIGACAAAMLGMSSPEAHAQVGQINRAHGFLSNVSILPEKGVIAITMNREVFSEDGPGTEPLILCPGASTEEGKLVAYVPDAPNYRTLIDRLFEYHGGTVETREARDGRCYVTSLSN